MVQAKLVIYSAKFSPFMLHLNIYIQVNYTVKRRNLHSASMSCQKAPFGKKKKNSPATNSCKISSGSKRPGLTAN